MIEVTLTDYEMAMASNAACLRHISAKRRGLPSLFAGREWQGHIEGACGEIAVAKLMGKYWGGSINTFKNGGDIDSTGWEVRTRSEHDYDLIVRHDDPDGRVFILVTGQSPEYLVWGWIRSEDAKKEEWQKNYGGHGAAFFVPKEALRQMGDLDEYRSANVGV
mgnify:FL=1|tara:strand:+ start:1925 stop:2413 length:489 start_codon:yes stop_codon:yes gene_type:complete